MDKLLALLLVGFAGTAGAANLLLNPGFETGDLSGWTVSGAAHGVGAADDAIPGPSFASTVAVKEGSFAAWGAVRGFCCTAPESVTFSQTLSVLAGTDYLVGFFVDNHSSTGVGYGTGSADNRIQIVVNGLGLLPTVDHGACPLDCLDPSLRWLGFEGLVNSGASTTLTVEYRIIASGTASVGLSVDDFYVIGPAAAVPEPGSLGLLVAAGACGLALRRRRVPNAAPARRLIVAT